MAGHVAALDSNAFTFFSDAVTEGYDPAQDDPMLARQRLSVLRGYLYGESTYTILKEVVREYRGILDERKLRQHDDIAAFLMLDAVPAPRRSDVDALSAHYLAFHPKEPDCRVLAEAEVLGVPYLITFDHKFLNRLSEKTKVTRLVTPTDYFESLGVQPGTEPRRSPHAANALASVSWWKV